jgi:adenylate kinase
VPEDELIRRLKGRYICRDCQAPHAGECPDATGDTRCSHCGGELYQRPDDSEEGVRTRLEVYRTETVPVLEFYREQELLANINGLGSVESVSQRLLETLGPDLIGPS